MQNYLKNETSPYLLQHADNPVNWYPWCEEAFAKAKKEEKPVFLSIGYSTCHWCHVMAHESFEDEEIAEILNQNFVSIKVDKEERPDIDSIYMSVCQAFTGSGGWPTTVFLTPDQKPFFAGTYFPKTSRYGQAGFKELLLAIRKKWQEDRNTLSESADGVLTFLQNESYSIQKEMDLSLIEKALALYEQMFDEKYGGFGKAPKFPTPHNLLFLMQQYQKNEDRTALEMVEKTLNSMYRGGMFDHIGGGFCRYSTDRYFLVPHFEKMLYDNALLIMTYSKAYQLTKKELYRTIAKRTADYVLEEMLSPEGGFFCAQDADSEGVEGKYYVFEPAEVKKVLGEEAGETFNRQFDITEKGNFEGNSIPNLLKCETIAELDLTKLYEYRKKRYHLHLDDKILTSWNGLMIAALCQLYRVSEKQCYLDAALRCEKFLMEKLCEQDVLYVSYRKEKRSQKGFLDDYANVILALLTVYEATLDEKYLEKAEKFCHKAVKDFWDEEKGGFFLYGTENETLIMRPKETYDGAMPSGNSMMARNLVQLFWLTEDEKWKFYAEKQLTFMSAAAGQYPAGYAMFLMALSDFTDMPDKLVVVRKGEQETEHLPCRIPLNTIIQLREEENGKTTFYLCKGRNCLPPVNKIEDLYQR